MERIMEDVKFWLDNMQYIVSAFNLARDEESLGREFKDAEDYYTFVAKSIVAFIRLNKELGNIKMPIIPPVKT